MDIKYIRYIISKISIYVFLFCITYLIQRFFFSFFVDYSKYLLFGRIHLHEVIFSVTSFLFVKKCFHISRLGE